MNIQPNATMICTSLIYDACLVTLSGVYDLSEWILLMRMLLEKFEIDQHVVFHKETLKLVMFDVEKFERVRFLDCDVPLGEIIEGPLVDCDVARGRV